MADNHFKSCCFYLFFTSRAKSIIQSQVVCSIVCSLPELSEFAPKEDHSAILVVSFALKWSRKMTLRFIKVCKKCTIKFSKGDTVQVELQNQQVVFDKVAQVRASFRFPCGLRIMGDSRNCQSHSFKCDSHPN